MTDENTQDTTAETEEGVTLSVNDLAAVVQLIDLCSQRGAFQGSELEAVGTLRGRVQAFVSANTAEEEQTDDETSTN